MDVSFQTSTLLQRISDLPGELLQLIRNGSNTEYLDAIAAVAGNAKFTDTILVSHNKLLPEIAARLISGSNGHTNVATFGRILQFAPFLAELVDTHLAGLYPNGCPPLSSDVQDESAACELLLGIHRLLVYDVRSFRALAKVHHLQTYLTHQSRPVRYLAIRCLCLCLFAADAAMRAMINVHLGNEAVLGRWEGRNIDFRFFTLWEERRYKDIAAALRDDHASAERQQVSPFPRQISNHEWSSTVVNVGGILIPSPQRQSANRVRRRLVPTTSTEQNLHAFAEALLDSSPILLEGLPGAGKSILVDHVAEQLDKSNNLITLHLNEQSDAKMLLGMHTTDSKPGSFTWRPGVLTTAVREGRWVLIEDLDRAPNEIIGTLLPLIENRELSIPSRGETIKAAHGFRIIATLSTSFDMNGREFNRAAGMLGLRFWHRVRIQGLSPDEVRFVVEQLYPSLVEHIPTILAVYGKVLEVQSDRAFSSRTKTSSTRPVTIRELIRWCERISRSLQRAGTYTSRNLDDIFLAALECFVGALSEDTQRHLLISAIAEELHLDPARRDHLSNHRSVTIESTSSGSQIRVGRALMSSRLNPHKMLNKMSRRPFAQNEHSLRLLEQIAVAVDCGEPLLLVGETGTGKTTVIQYLADQLGRKLIPFNLSQQSESGDLLGGFKPTNFRVLMLQLKEDFDDLFNATFGEKKNKTFVEMLSRYFAKGQWKQVCKMWAGALGMVEELRQNSALPRSKLPPKKKQKTVVDETGLQDQNEWLNSRWDKFASNVKSLSAQLAGQSDAFAFSFVEGNIVKAVRNGDWVLLDEINLASTDTLEALADLLQSGSDVDKSIILSETGSVERIRAHPDFRIFAAMNPATDVGKKDLPMTIRSRFTELFVSSPDQDFKSLQSIVASYLANTTDRRIVLDISKLYVDIQSLAATNALADGAGQKPHYSLRTLTRSLMYAKDTANLCSLRRALFEGFHMSFSTFLDRRSDNVLSPIISKHLFGDHPNARAELRRPLSMPTDGRQYVSIGQHWLRRGAHAIQDNTTYIITPSVKRNLENLIRSVSTRRFPVLIQGPTSSGKTSMIEYIARLSGNKFVRINNHEHTDLQEYLGTYVSDKDGKLRFQEGALVKALREGSWVVLDELNLAPTDVLEALNRLLDDNRELFIPETQETVSPHENFMLFATQNPAGLYGGRKVLSRAFRNRFLELHFDDIPVDELQEILHKRTLIPESWCRRIVEVYRELSSLRQETRMFEQSSFATLRDLFRWALRKADSVEELAVNGFMLLAERVRKPEERQKVADVIERILSHRGPRVHIDQSRLYSINSIQTFPDHHVLNENGIVWTKAMRRLYVLVAQALRNNEPVLLVGETGCGKTTVCQMLAGAMGKPLHILNAHQNTETGDLIGAQRPIRNRSAVEEQLRQALTSALELHVLENDISNLDVHQLAGLYDKLGKDQLLNIEAHLQEKIVQLRQRQASLFEWSDGSMVTAMRNGDHFLLDEISLADDSVLERLNSVLEPQRTLLLAEKGPTDSLVIAAEGFQFLATMNPGGDFGKRELSPALRNRFTEIWVPSLTDKEDILEITKARLTSTAAKHSEAMVRFAQWFHARYNTSTTCSVSIRDITAWTDFVRCFDEPDTIQAIVHGAAMVYIDTLGANPAAILSMSFSSIDAEKETCMLELGRLLCIDEVSRYFETSQVLLLDDRLQIGPFRIPRLSTGQAPKQFELNANTTTLNTMRVLRALQLPKPILLEGNPGVGKTSLVTTIAHIAGKRLERMNLSEQTDLMDLFGSDSPVEGQRVGSFEWRDGPFLTAMKQGDWVLLDEMNLASQSVLEGLNACLDHRGEIYIAELDQTFRKHPDFRLFAAQNPHHQGGGRKGLPASFVNRFSVVYTDVFRAEDMLMICQSSFPDADYATTKALIAMVDELSRLVTYEQQFGVQGSPWEFNLRDILRWLKLSQTKEGLLPSATSYDLVDILFSMRLRTSFDRLYVKELFEKHFQAYHPERRHFHNVSASFYQVGFAMLSRDPTFSPGSSAVKSTPIQHLPLIEALMLCLSQAWPVILVGATGSGKTSMLTQLAALVGSQLTTLSMHADIDAADLIGGFEQADPVRRLRALLRRIRPTVRDRTLRAICTVQLSELAESLFDVADRFREDEVQPSRLLDNVRTTLLHLKPDSGLNVEQLLEECNDIEQSLHMTDTARFEWMDGMLIHAVESGHWLVLDNANLCSSSVIDRLNSLLEPEGNLIVSEHATLQGEARVIKPHPSFRIIMTMDPRHGELSRAMRNRAVELFVPPQGNAFRREDFEKVFLTDSSMSRFRNFLLFEHEYDTGGLQKLPEVIADHLSIDDTHLLSAFNDQVLAGLLGSFDMSETPLRKINDLPSELMSNVSRFYQISLNEFDIDIDYSNFQPVHPSVNSALTLRKGHLRKPAQLLATGYDLAMSVYDMTAAIDSARQRHTRGQTMTLLEHGLRSDQTAKKSNAAKTGTEILLRVIEYLRSFVVSNDVSDIQSLGNALTRTSQSDEYDPIRRVNLWMHEMTGFWWTLLQWLENYNNDDCVVHTFVSVLQELTGFRLGDEASERLRSLHATMERHNSNAGQVEPGACMLRLWKALKPPTPRTYTELQQLLQLQQLAADLDQLALYRQIPLADVIPQRMMIMRALDTIPHAEDKLRDLLVAMRQSVDSLGDSQPTEQVQTHFCTSLRFILFKIESQRDKTSVGRFKDELTSTLSLLASVSGSLETEGKMPRLIHIALRIFGSDNPGASTVMPIPTPEDPRVFMESLYDIESVQLRQLVILETEMKVLGQCVSSESQVICRDTSDLLDDALESFFSILTDVHDDTLPRGSSLRILHRKQNDQQNVSSIPEDNEDSLLSRFLEKSLAPTASFLRLNIDDPQRRLEESAAAWITMACTALHLYIPEQPNDPVVHLNLLREMFSRKKDNLTTQLLALETFEMSFSGHTSSERIDKTKALLASIGTEPESPSIARPPVSQLQFLSNDLQSALRISRSVSGWESGSTKPEDIHSMRQNLCRLTKRMMKDYPGYSDVVQPVLGFLVALDVGLALSAQVCVSIASTPTISSCFPQRLLGLHPLAVRNQQTPLTGDSVAWVDAFDHPQIITSHVRLSTLDLLSINRSIGRLEQNGHTWNAFVDRQFKILYGLWKTQLDKDQQVEASKSSLYTFRGRHEDETTTEEQEFDELFSADEPDPGPNDQRTSLAMQQQLVLKVCEAHRSFYLGPEDSVKSLGTSLALAVQCSLKHQSKSDQHTFLSLEDIYPAMILELEEKLQLFRSHNQASPNFYRHSNIEEARKATNLVQRIEQRFTTLHNSWPEHATPGEVLLHAKEFLTASISEPLAKYLMKLQQIHGTLHQWERVASREFSAALLYDELTHLIISWRQLELRTWAHLVEDELENFNRDAQSWWFIAYENLIAAPESLKSNGEPLQQHAVELVQTLQSFFTTANLGQFSGRLRVLRQFREHLAIQALKDASYEATLLSIDNFITHFAPFVLPVESAVADGRRKVEKEIKDVIKLASWKDTTIEALHQSAKVSHRKLFRIIRKFRDHLRQPVAAILSQWPAKLNSPHPDDTAPLLSPPSSETLQRAQVICRQKLSGWEGRPSRLVNISTTVRLMESLGQLDSDFSRPSKAVTGFVVDLKNSVVQLQKETPVKMTEENSATIKHLRTRKRRLFADVLKEMRSMGLKSNLSESALQGQRSLASVLTSSPHSSFAGRVLHKLNEAEYDFHKHLHLMDDVRTATQEHSGDLTPAEIIRSTMYLEGVLQLTLHQRKELSNVTKQYSAVRNSIMEVQIIVNAAADGLSAASQGSLEQITFVKQRLGTLIPLTRFISQLVATQARLGSLEHTEIINGLVTWSEKLQAAQNTLDQQLPLGLITQKQFGDLSMTLSGLSEFGAEIDRVLLQSPGLTPTLGKLKPWLDLSGLTHSHKSTEGPSAKSSVEDFQYRLDQTADAMLSSIQDVQTARSSNVGSTQREAWLTSASDALEVVLRSFQLHRAQKLLRSIIESLQVFSAEDLKTCIAAMTAVMPIYQQFLRSFEQSLELYLNLHCSLCNMASELSGLFLLVRTKGFCTPPETSANENGQTQELEGGTGLGEGEGAEDISKDIQDDEDLTDLANQKQENDRSEDIETEKDAVDMADEEMEGELEDVSEVSDSGEQGSDAEDQESEEEVGDVDDLGPSTVDENLWDDGDAADTDKQKEDSRAKGKKDQDEKAAQGPAEAMNDEDQENLEDGAEEAEQVDTNRPEGLDAQAAEAENALDLPDDLQMDGKEEEISSMNDSDEIGDIGDEMDASDISEGSRMDDDDAAGLSDADSVGDKMEMDEDLEQTMDETQERGDRLEDQEEDAALTDDNLLALQPEEAKADANAVDHEQKGRGNDGAQETEDHDETDEQAQSTTQGRKGRQTETTDREEMGPGENGEELDHDRETTGRDDHRSAEQQAFRQLGNTLEQWFKQNRDIQEASSDRDKISSKQDVDMREADFEHLSNKADEADAQALGAAAEDQSKTLDDSLAIDVHEPELNEPMDRQEEAEADGETTATDQETTNQHPPATSSDEKGQQRTFIGTSRDQVEKTHATDATQVDNASDIEDMDSHMSTISLDHASQSMLSPREDALALWAKHEASTRTLSLALTEQLRLILAPTLATKMRGDFRTGKRLNIKRIIPYIASQYKRDKIWMRRSVPSKRNYQIMLALDDSRSMAESDSTALAFETLALITRSLTMLESGDVGVIRFGAEVEVAHDFGQPFTSDAGVEVLRRFGFTQTKTDVKKLISQSIDIFREARSKARGSGADLWQLQLIISDGICEDHNTIQRLVRQAQEERIMIVFVIVDAATRKVAMDAGEQKPQSITDLQTAEFVTDTSGEMKLVRRKYLDTFPFRWWLVVQDITELPGVLAMALRQWFAEVVDSAS